MITFFICFISVIALLELGQSVRPPCDEITHVDLHDFDFAHKNQNDLYADPKAYFEHDVLKSCNLRFVDIYKLGSPKKFTWVTYVGDSINRALFYAIATIFSGRLARENEDLIELSRKTFPLMGRHRCFSCDNLW